MMENDMKSNHLKLNGTRELTNKELNEIARAIGDRIRSQTKTVSSIIQAKLIDEFATCRNKVHKVIITDKPQRPKLIIVAGPNGSGKTTFTPQLIQHDWTDGCLFINPDEIAKNEFGDWNSPEAVLKAAVRAQELREECLKREQSMLMESVFSAPDKLDFLYRAKEAGFFIRFFFIGTDSPEINAARVARRVLHGGHEVPIAKIISRYPKSIASASVALQVADRGYVYDNSTTDRNPRILFRVRDGNVVKEYADLKRHLWAQMKCREVRTLTG